MHRIAVLVSFSSLLLFSSCNDAMKEQQKQFYTEDNVNVVNGKLTPELLWQMPMVGSPAVSPDNKLLLFTVSKTNIDDNSTDTEIYVAPTDNSSKPYRVISAERKHVNQPAFMPDGKIAYLRTARTENSEGKYEQISQLYIANADGSRQKKLTSFPEGVEAFLFSPSGNKIAIVSKVKTDQSLAERHPDMSKANVIIEDDLMYRHWDEWEDGKFSHIHVADFDGKSITNIVDIMQGERHHSPLRPFGGVEQICWDNNGSRLAYTSKKKEGIASALSTNSDIYIYDLATNTTTNISAPNLGYDTEPIFSHDGSAIYWLSMEHDGYESDRNRIFRHDFTTKKTTDLTEKSELYIQSFALSADDKKIYFVANDEGCDAIFELYDGSVRKVTTDVADYYSLAVADDCVYALRTTMFAPPDVFKVSSSGNITNVTNANYNTLQKLNLGNVEERWLTTTDGKKMHTWVVLPPNFDAHKKYPALLYCQGGPQSTVSQFWSRRWNFALMAANGYVVVAPNRRGLPGFGIEWNEQISKDYGGQNMKDYLTAIDSIATEPFVDEEKLGCVGASYGGFSVYWLAGHHNKRFKTFIAHCGIFNLEQLYSTTEELFFVNWDLGGPYWQTDNKYAVNSFAQSPHRFVAQWDTPIMVIHGEKDFRIPYTQGMGAFNVARMLGIEARFLYFPDECHWVSQPQNSIVWHREFYNWLDKWLK